MLVDFIIAVALISSYLIIAHYASYTLGMNRVLKKQKWDLNICCGRPDGAGVNVDIIQHKDLPDFFKLPFADTFQKRFGQRNNA